MGGIIILHFIDGETGVRRVKILLWSESLCSSTNAYVEFLMPDVMVLGHGAFGRCLGHEGGALINKLNAFFKNVSPQSSLGPSTM